MAFASNDDRSHQNAMPFNANEEGNELQKHSKHLFEASDLIMYDCGSSS